jgi:hypothetical protein
MSCPVAVMVGRAMRVMRRPMAVVRPLVPRGMMQPVLAVRSQRVPVGCLSPVLLQVPYSAVLLTLMALVVQRCPVPGLVVLGPGVLERLQVP